MDNEKREKRERKGRYADPLSISEQVTPLREAQRRVLEERGWIESPDGWWIAPGSYRARKVYRLRDAFEFEQRLAQEQGE